MTTATRTATPFMAKLKKIADRFTLNYDDIENDLADIATAGVITFVLTVVALVYIFARFPFYPNLGEIAGLYVLFNVVMMIRFIYSRARNAWTLDQLGNELHNYIETRKASNDI